MSRNANAGESAIGARTVKSAPRSARLRLLRALSQDSGYATHSSLGAAALDVFSQRNGVSLRTASASPDDAKELVSQGLAQWRRGAASRRDRLEITAAGHAFLARLDADPDVEPYLAQHTEIVRRDIAAQGVTKTVAIDNGESALVWLATRRNSSGESLLDPTLLEAGERLRRELTFAQMTPRTTANWDPSLAARDGYAAPLSFSEAVISARQRVESALRAVGPDFAGLLMDVCGFLKGLELIEAERRWPRRSAKLVLEMALSALARHYGLQTQAKGPARSLGVRHWGAQDYRPKISQEPASD